MSRTPHTDKLFNDTACLSLLAFELYRDKLLDNDEKVMVEAHLRECPLCKDAIEGLSGLKEGSGARFYIGRINTRLQRKYNYTPSRRETEKKGPRLRQWLIPAAAAIIILAGLIAYFQYFFPEQRELAMLPPVESREAKEEAGEDMDKAMGNTHSGEKDESTSQDLTTNTKAVTGGIAAPVTAMTIVADTEAVYTETVNDIEEEEIVIVEPDEEMVMVQQQEPPKAEEVSAYSMNEMAEAEAVDKASSKSISRLRKGKHDPDTTMVFVVVEQMPEFPGGMDSLDRFLQKNLRIPKTQISVIHETSYIEFTVYEDGSIDDIKVLRSAGGIYDREAIRVVEMMPPWIPGKQRGMPVAVQYTLPVKFIKE
jgi:outer membrane biosynthesis protein TonB